MLYVICCQPPLKYIDRTANEKINVTSKIYVEGKITVAHECAITTVIRLRVTKL